MINPRPSFQVEKKKQEYLIEIAQVMNAEKTIFDNNHMAHRTQLVYSNQFSEKYQAKIFLKREDEQKGKYKPIQAKPSRSEDLIINISQI